MNDADTDQALDPNSSIFQSIMQNAIVQRTLNSPKTFFSQSIDASLTLMLRISLVFV